MKAVVKNRFDKLLQGEDVSDNINVFIKPEPHKNKKLKEKKERLISGISLVDTMIDRVLFGWIGRAALDSVGSTPCLVGWSPLRGGWKLLRSYYEGKRVLCMDKSAWDWTVPYWVIQMFEQFVLSLPYNSPSWWRNMVTKRFELLFKQGGPVFEFSDGTKVTQAVSGIMKSGCFLTILLNSVSQSLLHYVANIRLGKRPKENQPHTVGDDTLQPSFGQVGEYVRHMEDMGIKIKGYVSQDWIEFCGFATTDAVCIPAYWQKHLFSLAHNPNLEESIFSYQVMYVHEPVMWRFVQLIAKELGPEYVADWFEARSIFDDERV